MSTETFLLFLATLATVCSKKAMLNPRIKARAQRNAGKKKPELASKKVVTKPTAVWTVARLKFSGVFKVRRVMAEAIIL